MISQVKEKTGSGDQERCAYQARALKENQG